MPENDQDPYLYPNSLVLINKFGIKDAVQLQEVEGFIFASKLPLQLPSGNFDYKHLKAIHYYFFNEIYEWAGQERVIDIAKGDCYFGHKQYITSELHKLFVRLEKENYLRELKPDLFCQRLSYYFNEINAAHPFREGNGRTQRAFCDLITERACYELNWSSVNREEYLDASISGFLKGDYNKMESIFKKIISPLQQSLDHGLVNKKFNSDILIRLTYYAEKQVHLSELIKQKNKLNKEDVSGAKNILSEVKNILVELKGVSNELLSLAEIQSFLKQSQIKSLAQQGGFAVILNRFKNNEFKEEDLSAVVRHVKNNLHELSQSLMKNNRSQ